MEESNTFAVNATIQQLQKEVLLSAKAVSAFHTPGHYIQKPGIVTHVFGEHAQVPGHYF